jgi:putative lipoprotein
MCPSSPLNDRILKDWQYVRSYAIKDSNLFLSLMADGGIYEFEPKLSDEKASATQQPSSSTLTTTSAARVRGTATYRERMVLPPGAVFEAVLEDVSRADAPAHVIGRAHIDGPGNPPIPYSISYDPSRIDPSHRYAVRARIVASGKLLFTSDQYYPVLTAGESNEVDLLLRRAGASSAASGGAGGSNTPPGKTASTEPLENTYWKLIRLGDTAVTVAPQQQEPHFVLNSQTRRVGGSGGCNRLNGGYAVNGDRLTFSQLAGTMMARLQGMETEKAFLQALPQVSKWKITGQHLELFDASGNVIASFEARQIK